MASVLQRMADRNALSHISDPARQLGKEKSEKTVLCLAGNNYAAR